MYIICILIKNKLLYFLMTLCLRYDSLATMRHHDQGNSYKKKAFNWGLAFNFKGLVYYHVGKQTGMVLEQ